MNLRAAAWPPHSRSRSSAALSFLSYALSLRRPFGAALIGFVFQPLADFAAGEGGGQAALRGLFQSAGKRAADADHRFDDLVHRDHGVDAGHRQLGGGESVHSEERVALDARDLYQTADRITHQSERVLECQRSGM